MKFSPITLHDGYKLDHRRQFPDGLRYMQSNFTPRGSRRDSTHVVFGGLQYFIRRYLMEAMDEDFFSKPKDRVVNRFLERINKYAPGNNIGSKHIEQLHDLGYVPLRFNALPEGTLCPLRVPMFTVENTHPDFAWLVNFYETLLSSIVWPVSTSATTAYKYRNMMDEFAFVTGGDAEFVPWQGHDFSMRGMMGPEAAALSGLGHLFSFFGSDTLPVMDMVENYYTTREEIPIICGSIPATEHAVMCAGGKEDELETYRRLLKLYPTGPVSIVSDTWDYWRVLGEVLPKLKDEILSRDGTLVIRPDSGDPVKILCGDKDSKNPLAYKGTVEALWDLFGGSLTSTNFKRLDPHINAIYGDSITLERAEQILGGLTRKGFCPTVVLGIGSFTYQYVTRDTEGFAMKATWAKVGDEERELFKSPVTDDGTKHSAKGRLAVLRDPDTKELYLKQSATVDDEFNSAFDLVWQDGKFIKEHSLNDIRRRLHPNWKV